MRSAASALSAAALIFWALVATTDRLQQPAAAPAPRVSAPATPSALGDISTLSRYPGN